MRATYLLTERLVPGRALAYAGNLTASQTEQTELQAFSVDIGELNTVHVFGTGDLQKLAGRNDLDVHRVSPAQISPITPLHGSIRHDPGTTIYELRDYLPRLGQADGFIARMLEAMAVREKYSPCSGIWKREQEGRVRVLHLWGYRDFAHRDAARAGVATENAWTDYAAYALSVLEHMRSDLILPIATS